MRATQLKKNRNVKISKKETGPAGHTLLCPWANLPSQRLCQESDRQRNTGSCAELSSDMLCKCVDIRFCFATPAIAQLVEHLTVDPCSNQMVPGSIPGGRILGGRGGYLATRNAALVNLGRSGTQSTHHCFSEPSQRHATRHRPQRHGTVRCGP